MLPDKLGARECTIPLFVVVSPVVLSALLDPERVVVGTTPFLPAGPSDGRDAGRDGFLGAAAGLVSLGSPAASPMTDLDFDAAVAALIREAFVGDPAPKFHTLRTIDFAEERNPKRGVALPLSAK